ncbi:MAG: peptidoglycan-binding protein LysM [Bacteroidia bacterium]|nr:peptidoglycan-binding protein LysM [Bacteroidia bacterium]NND52195.1 peptidoglycan-binding protein LysM [Flavobacteriaceae bacterium]
MKRFIVIYSLMPFAIVAGLFYGLNSSPEIDLCLHEVNQDLNYNLVEMEDDMNQLDVKTTSACFASPDLGKSFVGFKEAIAFKESTGDYFSVNTLGYLGKYQFGKETLKLIGVYNTNDFLKNPQLQEKAFIANTMRNKWVLRRDINRFVGKRIDGVLVTESGILAAAHLAGPGSVKKYLRSYGALGFTDAYGTSIRKYMKRFSGYDTSFIKPDKKAKVSRL